MDPDAALDRLRTWANRYDSGNCDDPTCSDAVDAFQGLDDWMSRGGYSPSVWTKPEDDR